MNKINGGNNLRILILTKNILAEVGIQQKLQRMNYEVFCTNISLNDMDFVSLVNLFPTIIISETISEYELDEVMSTIQKQSTIIVRKFDCEDVESKKQSKNINYFIHKDSNTEQIREIFVGIAKVKDVKPDICIKQSINFSIFSNKERLLLSTLYKYHDTCLTREEICLRLWKGKLRSKSHLVYLSKMVNSVRIKTEKLCNRPDSIITLWGNGYVLSDELYELLKIEESNLENYTSN